MFAFPFLCILNVQVHGLHPMLLGGLQLERIGVEHFFGIWVKLIDCLTALGA